MSLILCGFFCAGKSTIGKMCAEQLRVPCYDTDRLLEQKYNQGKSVAEIWQAIGAEAFRDLETEVILSLKDAKGVISLGGGSLLRTQNCTFVKKLGVLVYLKASADLLYQRILKRGLPTYLDKANPLKHFTEMALHRFCIYEKQCQYRIETEYLSEKQVLERVCQIASDTSSASLLGVNPMARQLV